MTKSQPPRNRAETRGPNIIQNGEREVRTKLVAVVSRKNNVEQKLVLSKSGISLRYGLTSNDIMAGNGRFLS